MSAPLIPLPKASQLKAPQSKPSPPLLAPPKKRKSRRKKFIAGVLFGLIIGLAIYLNSDSFRETVRRKVVAEL